MKSLVKFRDSLVGKNAAAVASLNARIQNATQGGLDEPELTRLLDQEFVLGSGSESAVAAAAAAEQACAKGGLPSASRPLGLSPTLCIVLDLVLRSVSSSLMRWGGFVLTRFNTANSQRRLR